ncbi:hypothetical protein FIM10_14070 [Sphingomonadales bacterium 56]|uniref:YceI family protein n=1 Tax=unclassified Sphingobium TaxID=2611147 RepID=UPI00191B4F34|nr:MULTISPECIES: YceI family protein [unclassified Sphingobium]MBY2929801.1 hypothetical protein [Sphingomonadales bacterium 56]MBY2960016.1 hypothetical protein [Sphingomonadales bacterium 58]CAD7340145.1 Protein YceI [Sphingobium sp. S6]CAD7340279.1 Protein YceI [Sphingobium sp. S8]
MSPQRYSIAAIALHWSIAAALAFQLSLGWQLSDISPGAGQFAAYQLHKSVGIVILLLTLARVAIRIFHPRPDALTDDRLAAFAAKATHRLLYAVMLLGPLSGWALVSTSRLQVPTLLFGTIPWPHLPITRSFNGIAYDAHLLTAYLLAGLIVLHVAGAIRHQFFKGENLLTRMAPRLAPGVAMAGALAIMTLAASASFLLTGKTATAVPQQQLVPPSMKAADSLPPSSPAQPSAAAPEAQTPEVKAEAAAIPLSQWRLTGPGKLGFTAMWNGAAVNGSFRRWTSEISYSPDDLPGSAITVMIDLASTVTGDSQRDETLQGPDYFGVSAHPEAVFRAKGFRPKGDDRYETRGTLDLNGRSHPVTLRFTLRQNGHIARAEGGAEIDRNLFGVGSATDETIAAKVAVSFALTAQRVDQ